VGKFFVFITSLKHIFLDTKNFRICPCGCGPVHTLGKIWTTFIW